MTQTIPPPNQDGYQPAPGEGIVDVSVEVRPSWGFQAEGVTARYLFPAPRSLAEAVPAIESLRAGLQELAAAGVDNLVALRKQREEAERAQQQAVAQYLPPAPVPQAPAVAAPAPAPVAAPVPVPQAPAVPGQLPWQYGAKPKGDEKVKYLPTSVYPQQAFIDAVKNELRQQGVDPEQVVVFDDRTGQYGLESGSTSYSVGKVKPRKDTLLASQVGDRNVAWVDFNDDGTVKVKLTKDAETALAAIAMATQMAQQQAAVVQASFPQATPVAQPGLPPVPPPPGDDDVPF